VELLLAIYCLLSFGVHFCSHEKVNYCKIRNDIIKTAISSDGKHFLICIYVPKVLFLVFI